MNLSDWLFFSICLNATCDDYENVEDDVGGKVSERTRKLKELEIEMKGKVFKIATAQNVPISYTKTENGKTVGYGVAFELINSLQKLYQFDYELIDVDGYLGNETDGILGLLSNGKVDIGATFLPHLHDVENITYSVGLDVGEFVVMMKRPSESATGSGLLAPFTIGVWMLSLVSLLLIGPIICWILRFKRKIYKDNEQKEAYPLPACVWFAYGALLKQGTTLSPVTDSTRILFATWWLFITVLTAFYTANLTAFLTLSQFTLPISNPRDIGEKHYHWVTREGNFIDSSLADKSGALSEDLRGSSGVYLDNNEHEEDILENWINKREYMFIDERITLEHYMYSYYLKRARENKVEEERCTFVITDWSLVKRSRAFAFSINFKYTEVFQNALQRVVESGIAEYLKRLGLPKSRICPLNLESNERKLKNVDLLLTYKIMCCGYLISFVGFLAELVVRHGASWKKALKLAQKGKLRHKRKELQRRHLNSKYQETVIFGGDVVRKVVNGTEYLVRFGTGNGSTLLPVRTPSAILFRYIDGLGMKIK